MKRIAVVVLLSLAVVALAFVGYVGIVGTDDKHSVEVEGMGSAEPEDMAEGVWSDAIIVTENYPPLNYEEDGVLKGSSTELVKQAITTLGVDIPMRVYPWARAYEMAQRQEDVLIYSITRTEEREDMFKWIAPVSYNKVYLYALAENEVEINDIEDVRTNDYKISTMNEDFTEQGLKSMGYEDHISSVPSQELSIAQLFEGRTDLWIATAEGESLKKLCEDAGYDFNSLEMVLEVEELRADLYIAASLQTSDEVVEKFREAMPEVPN